MNWSPKRTLAAGAALILGVNVIALAGVAYNRTEPESTLLLTERELRRPHQDWLFRHDNSGLALKLQWRVRTDASEKSEAYYPYMDYYGDPVWLTSKKLAELGMDISVSPDTERGKRHYEKQTAREVLLVLELDGENYRAALEQARAQVRQAATAPLPSERGMISRQEAAAKRLEYEVKSATRLFAVDAGTDAQALRSKYPDRSRYAIVRGRIQPGVTGEGRQARMRGYIQALSIDHVNIPLEMRAVFEGIPADYGYGTPTRRFEALLAHGRRLEPWLVSARKL